MLDVFVATVDVIDAIDYGGPFGHEAGQHQAGGGAQVGRHHLGTLELGGVAADGHVALKLDVGAHPHQLGYVHEAVLEDGLGDHAGTLGHRVQDGELGLHVGRERRVGGGLDGDRLQGATCHVEGDPVVTLINQGASLFQLDQYGFQQAGVSVAAGDLATGDRCTHQEGPGLDAIRLHAVAATVQTLDAVDGQGVGARALDLGAQGVEEVGQVDHFRLARGVFDHGATVGQGGGHHQVLGAGDGDHVHQDVGTLQATVDTGLDVAILDGDLGAHQLQAMDVQVDRTGTDGATARQGDVGRPEAGCQRTQCQDGGAHGLHQLVGGDVVVHGPGQHGHIAVDLGGGAQHLQQLEGGAHVLEARNVGELHLFIAQQGGEQDRQGGVLGAGDGHFTGKGAGAGDLEFVHGLLLYQIRRAAGIYARVSTRPRYRP